MPNMPDALCSIPTDKQTSLGFSSGHHMAAILNNVSEKNHSLSNKSFYYSKL